MQAFCEDEMIIGFVKERPAWEYRVAVVPQTVKQLIALGHQVCFENGCGERAGYFDNQYIEAGAQQLRNAAAVYAKSDLIIKIWAPHEEEYGFLHEKLWIVANFESYKRPERLKIWKKYKINALAIERVPRLSRIQDIDTLSSQHNLAGYKAALIAMDMSTQSVPLMMTAAGVLPPMKALVIGAGVAGLQAVATLQRMGAQVFASDVREETAEQAKSLGAQFIETTPENIDKILPECGIVITCVGLISGHVPQLISAAQLRHLPMGAVVLDMAVGNVEGSVSGRLFDNGHYKLLSDAHLAADVAYSASFLHSCNMCNLVSRWDKLSQDKEVWSALLISQEKDEGKK